MAGKTRDARIEALKEKLKELEDQKNRPRLQVTVSVQTKMDLAPIYHGRQAGPIIVKEAEKLTLLQALKLLAVEDQSVLPEDGKHLPTVIVTPTPALLERAARWYVGPQILIRAACVKIARKLKWMEDRDRGSEYMEELGVTEDTEIYELKAD